MAVSKSSPSEVIKAYGISGRMHPVGTGREGADWEVAYLAGRVLSRIEMAGWRSSRAATTMRFGISRRPRRAELGPGGVRWQARLQAVRPLQSMQMAGLKYLQ